MLGNVDEIFIYYMGSDMLLYTSTPPILINNGGIGYQRIKTKTLSIYAIYICICDNIIL